jgi:hypothetical protein
LGGHRGRHSGAAVEVPGHVSGVLVAELGGGGVCQFRCLWCVSCSGRVASFVRRCRSSVLGVRSVGFVLDCVSRFVQNSLLS